MCGTLAVESLIKSKNTDRITLAATVREEPTYLLLHSKARELAPAI